MSKWKCDICNSEFNNYHAEGFNNKIYCPLCYYKHEHNDLKQQLSQLQQENQKLNDSINQSNLAKINALLKLEKLQQEKEELIKWLEYKKKEYYADNEDNVIKNVTLTQVLNKLKEGDK